MGLQGGSMTDETVKGEDSMAEEALYGLGSESAVNGDRV